MTARKMPGNAALAAAKVAKTRTDFLDAVRLLGCGTTKDLAKRAGYTRGYAHQVLPALAREGLLIRRNEVRRGHTTAVYWVAK